MVLVPGRVGFLTNSPSELPSGGLVNIWRRSLRDVRMVFEESHLRFHVQEHKTDSFFNLPVASYCISGIGLTRLGSARDTFLEGLKLGLFVGIGLRENSEKKDLGWGIREKDDVLIGRCSRMVWGTGVGRGNISPPSFRPSFDLELHNETTLLHQLII